MLSLNIVPKKTAISYKPPIWSFQESVQSIVITIDQAFYSIFG